MDLSTQPFAVYAFICPACGKQVELGEDYPERYEECYRCNSTVRMES